MYENKPINGEKLVEALKMLNDQLFLAETPPIRMIVCGGSALIATGLVSRTTRDIDILAFMNEDAMIDCEPLPQYLLDAAGRVAQALNLPGDWVNSGPAMQFRMGLPAGFQSRLHRVDIGAKLTVFFIDRLDQIHFKTYAAADRGGYHVSDLRKLNPTEDELVMAAKWSMTQDVSEGFHLVLKDMFMKLGWPHVAERI